jgi:hypothetical protein
MLSGCSSSVRKLHLCHQKRQRFSKLNQAAIRCFWSLDRCQISSVSSCGILGLIDVALLQDLNFPGCRYFSQTARSSSIPDTTALHLHTQDLCPFLQSSCILPPTERICSKWWAYVQDESMYVCTETVAYPSNTFALLASYLLQIFWELNQYFRPLIFLLCKP